MNTNIHKSAFLAALSRSISNSWEEPAADKRNWSEFYDWALARRSEVPKLMSSERGRQSVVASANTGIDLAMLWDRGRGMSRRDRERIRSGPVRILQPRNLAGYYAATAPRERERILIDKATAEVILKSEEARFSCDRKSKLKHGKPYEYLFSLTHGIDQQYEDYTLASYSKRPLRKNPPPWPSPEGEHDRASPEVIRWYSWRESVEDRRKRREIDLFVKFGIRGDVFDGLAFRRRFPPDGTQFVKLVVPRKLAVAWGMISRSVRDLIRTHIGDRHRLLELLEAKRSDRKRPLAVDALSALPRPDEHMDASLVSIRSKLPFTRKNTLEVICAISAAARLGAIKHHRGAEVLRDAAADSRTIGNINRLYKLIGDNKNESYDGSVRFVKCSGKGSVRVVLGPVIKVEIDPEDRGRRSRYIGPPLENVRPDIGNEDLDEIVWAPPTSSGVAKHPFRVGRKYRDYEGPYTVLALHSEAMTIRYDFGLEKQNATVFLRARIHRRIIEQPPPGVAAAIADPQPRTRMEHPFVLGGQYTDRFAKTMGPFTVLEFIDNALDEKKLMTIRYEDGSMDRVTVPILSRIKGAPKPARKPSEKRDDPPRRDIYRRLKGLAAEEAKRAVGKYYSIAFERMTIAIQVVKEKMYDDLVQIACEIALTEKLHGQPLSGKDLRRKIRSRFPREIAKFWSTYDYTFSEAPQPDREDPEEKNDKRQQWTPPQQPAARAGIDFFRHEYDPRTLKDLEPWKQKLFVLYDGLLEPYVEGLATQAQVGAELRRRGHRGSQSKVCRDLDKLLVAPEPEQAEIAKKFECGERSNVSRAVGKTPKNFQRGESSLPSVGPDLSAADRQPLEPNRSSNIPPSGIIPMSVPLPWVNVDLPRYRRVLGCFKGPAERLMIAASYVMFGKPEEGFFDQGIINARRLHPSRGDVRVGRSGLSSVAHTLHCVEGGRRGAGCSQQRISELGLEFVDVEMRVGCSAIWELRQKAAD
jgi:hypothetical protein